MLNGAFDTLYDQIQCISSVINKDDNLRGGSVVAGAETNSRKLQQQLNLNLTAEQTQCVSRDYVIDVLFSQLL